MKESWPRKADFIELDLSTVIIHTPEDAEDLWAEMVALDEDFPDQTVIFTFPNVAIE